MFKAIIKTTVATHIINSENLEKVLEAIRDYTELEEFSVTKDGREIPKVIIDILLEFGENCEVLEAYSLDGWKDGKGLPITVLGLRIKSITPEGVEFIDEVSYHNGFGYWDGEIDFYDTPIGIKGEIAKLIDKFDEDPGTVLIKDDEIVDLEQKLEAEAESLPF